jgi:hypothetical protein
MLSTRAARWTLAVLLAAAAPALAEEKKKDPDLQRAQDAVNRDKPQKGSVRTDPEKGRVSVENEKGQGVYVEGGGKPPSHDNPKGEVKGGAGVQIRFGGDKKEEKKKDK